MASPDGLAEIASWVVGERPLREALDRVAAVARDLVPGASEASVTLVEMPFDLTLGATSDRALALDERQGALGRGPCLDAAYGGSPVIVADMATEDRWPQYTPRALELGVHSSLSVPLPTQEHLIAAINWYGDEADAFSPDDVEPAADFTARVAVVITNASAYDRVARLAAQMQDAMHSRATIEQAKGVLMATRGIDADEAFDVLVRASQRANRKLRDIAALVVERRNAID